MEEDKKNKETLFDWKEEKEKKEEFLKDEKPKEEKKIKNLIALSMLLGGLFLGSVFVDVAQLVKGSGFSQKALSKMDIFELGGKTWVAYPEPIVKVQVVSDDTCQNCAPDEVLVWLRRALPTILTEKIDANSSSGKLFVSQQGLKTIPAFVFSGEVEKTDFFQQAQILFNKKNDKYILSTSELGVPVGKYLETPAVGENDIKIGPEDAKVKVVEFSDFQCPYCKAFHATALKNMLSDYRDKVLFVFKNFPLDVHAQSGNSALAAECANEQGKFMAYADRLFNSQDSWGKTEGTQSFKTMAQQIYGMNVAQFNKCLDDKKYQDKINQDKEEAKSFDVSGTPAIFINDQFKNGTIDYNALKAAIDEELAK
jgi:protein-disulfide isomerase